MQDKTVPIRWAGMMLKQLSLLDPPKDPDALVIFAAAQQQMIEGVVKILEDEVFGSEIPPMSDEELATLLAMFGDADDEGELQ